MIELTINRNKLKKALSVISLAVQDKGETIWGHSLFKVESEKVTVYATDKKRIALAKFDAVTNSEGQFTVSPKKILALLTSTDVEDVRIQYNSEKNTVKVYASENESSFLSFESFDPTQFLSFEEELRAASDIKTINANVFLNGLRFIQGFIPKNDIKEKFSRMYINDGIMCGSDGSNRIGAYQSEDISDINDLIIRKQMIPLLIQMIDRTDLSQIIIQETSKKTLFLSEDKSFGFGFVKENDQQIKFPVNMDRPDTDGFSINREDFLKKMNRLSIAAGNDVGVNIKIENDKLYMKTSTERVSVENIDCKKLKGNDREFVIQHRLFKPVLSLFKTPEIEIYVKENNCVIFSEAELDIYESKEKPITKKFKTIALMSLARIV